MNRPQYPPEAQAQATYRPPPFRPRPAPPPPTRNEPSHPPGWIRPKFKFLRQPTTSADYPPQGPVPPRTFPLSANHTQFSSLLTNYSPGPSVATSHDQPTFHSAIPPPGPVGSLDPGFSWHPQASTLRDQAPPLSVTSYLAVRDPPQLSSGPGSFQRQPVPAPKAHGHDGRPYRPSGAASLTHGKFVRPWDQRDRAPEPRLPPLPPPPPPPPPPPARSEPHVAEKPMAVGHTKAHPHFSPPLTIAQYQLKIFKDNHTCPASTSASSPRYVLPRVLPRADFFFSFAFPSLFYLVSRPLSSPFQCHSSNTSKPRG